MDKRRKVKTSFALSEEARQLIDGLGKRLGLSQASIVEMSVRKLALSEGFTLPQTGIEESKAEAQQ